MQPTPDAVTASTRHDTAWDVRRVSRGLPPAVRSTGSAAGPSGRGARLPLGRVTLCLTFLIWKRGTRTVPALEGCEG